MTVVNIKYVNLLLNVRTCVVKLNCASCSCWMGNVNEVNKVVYHDCFVWFTLVDQVKYCGIPWLSFSIGQCRTK